MKVKDLDNNSYNLKLIGYVVQGNDTRHRSQLHIRARRILKDMFPTMQILEEIPIKLRQNENGFLDFYINTIKTVVEVHGEQHYKFNPLFHTSSFDFINQQKKDRDKQTWCEINNLTYVELPYNEGEEEWEKRLQLRSNS